MRFVKRCLSVFLISCMLIYLIPVYTIKAQWPEQEKEASIIATGTYNDNITWTVTDDNTLTLSGTKKVDKPDADENGVLVYPWHAYRDFVTTCIIEEGITYLYNDAFFCFNALTCVYFPASLQKIYKSFSACENIQMVCFAGSASRWRDMELEKYNPELFYGEFVSLLDIQFAGGEGTTDNPYRIATAEQLDHVRNALDAHFIQISDIDLNGIVWQPIGSEDTPFTGTYDGCGYTISNLNISGTYDQQSIGLFGAAGRNSGTSKEIFSNIRLKNTSIELNFDSFPDFNGCRIGALVGSCNHTIISSCSSEGTIQFTGICTEQNRERTLFSVDVGGISGKSGRFQNCTNYADIICTIKEIEGNDKVIGKSHSVDCGGICGYGGNYVTCVNYGDILIESVDFVCAGGIVGDCTSDFQITNCINYGSVFGKTQLHRVSSMSGDRDKCNVGGIIGNAWSGTGHIEDCINYGDVYGRSGECHGYRVGGIIGYGHSQARGAPYLKNCFSMGYSVTAEAGGEDVEFEENEVDDFGDLDGGRSHIINSYAYKGIIYEGEGPAKLCGIVADYDYLTEISSYIHNAFETEPVNIVSESSFQGHHYQILDYSMTWTAAKDYCERLGGHLVTITSEEEQAFIETLLTEDCHKKQYWIGASMDGSSSKAEWVSGEDFEYTNWSSNEPINESIDGFRTQFGQLLNEVNTDYNPGSEIFKWSTSFKNNTDPAQLDYYNANYVGLICEYDYLPSDSDGFSAEYDGWSFVNGYEGFDYPSDYSIPEERYEEVFGASYVATAKANGKAFKSMLPDWSGNCLGMSATAALFYLGMLDWNDYSEAFGRNHETINSYYERKHFTSNSEGTTLHTLSSETSEVTKLIERYMILQMGSENGYVYEDASWLELSETSEYEIKVKDGIWEHNPNGEYIGHLLQTIQETKVPLLLLMCYQDGRHAVVVRTDRAPEKQEDGWYRVYIYDPNKPYLSEEYLEGNSVSPADYYSNNLADDVYIELNEELNQWRYYGSTIKNIPSKYRGSTESGEVKYFSDGEIKKEPEWIFLCSVDNTEIPTEFDGTEAWLTKWEDEIDVIVTTETNGTVFSSVGDVLCELIDGTPVIYDESVEFYPYMDEVENGNSVSGGRLGIPYDDIRIEYRDGSDITILSSNTAVNVASQGDVSVAVSAEENTVKLTGLEDSEITTQITEVFNSSTYTSIVADGALNKSDVLTIQMEAEHLKASLTGEGNILIYTDNEDEQEEKLVCVLDTNEVVMIENLRDLKPHVALRYENESIACTMSNLFEEASIVVAFYNADGKMNTVIQETAENKTYVFTPPADSVLVNVFVLDDKQIPLIEKTSRQY